MIRPITLALLGCGCLAAPALAQTNNPPAGSSSAPQAGASNQSQGAANKGQFITTQAARDWRGSKIVGLTIYGENNEKVGDVNEIFINDHGQVSAVVIGVGGFLGLGEKDVAVPFSAIRWVSLGTTSGTGFSSSGSGTTASGSPSTGSSPQNPTTSNDAFVMTGGIPNHPVLSMTKEDLRNAPEFRYAGRDQPGQGGGNTSSNRLAPPTSGTAPSR